MVRSQTAPVAGVDIAPFEVVATLVRPATVKAAGSTLATVPSPCSCTHTAPSPATRNPGVSPSPTVPITVLVAGSIFCSSLPSLDTAQIASNPKARYQVSGATSMVAITALVAGSIRATLPAGSLATQTEPAPATTLVSPLGLARPLAILASSWADSRLIR